MTYRLWLASLHGLQFLLVLVGIVALGVGVFFVDILAFTDGPLLLGRVVATVAIVGTPLALAHALWLRADAARYARQRAR